ncbi:MMPL family transporter [Catenulispora pinisilvae]|uniref:MMPL family transporter n=1 Tax=Catenulispora pinisilvae TaxID=2705253 RepID=UPI001890E52B|nr:MMPL family transporter [Catenulispora pinisilvae]
MSSYLFRIARWAFRRRRLVLAVWVIVVVAMIAVAGASGGKTNDSFTIPGTESQRVTDLLKVKLPALSGAQTTVVFAVPSGTKVTDPGPKAGIEQAVTNLEKVPGVVQSADPFQGGPISQNGQVALGNLQWSQQPPDIKDSALNDVKAAVAPARAAGVQVEYNGSVYPGWRVVPSELPELVGLVIAFFILLITFGSLVAAGLPIMTAIIGVITTVMAVTALAAVMTIASTSTTVAIMLGLSCGIDYGLFIIHRHRDGLLRGMPPEEAVGVAAGTAGSSVVFAACTVMIALCGLAVVGIPFLTIMGVAAAGAVFLAMLISLTLIPAMLGFAGDKLKNFSRFPFGKEHSQRIAHQTVQEPETAAGWRWARFVVHHRIPVLLAGVALLLLLASPALKIQTGLPGASSNPKSDTSRKAYDITTANFGPGFNGALLVVADGVSSQQQVSQIAAGLAKQPGVAVSTPAALNGSTAVIKVVPTTGPSDPATATLVHHLRDNRAAIAAGSGANVLIGGVTASNIDVSSKLNSALPIFLIVVVGLAFILLTFAFRTIWVPIKSIIGFLLSVAAALGAQVALFQWGWGEKIFNITKSETISFLPIIMIAIIFGLSSDYEIFVVSRIKEDFTKNGNAVEAVRRGAGTASRVVTAAALIMFSIFVAFIVSPTPTIKAIGFSFAAGVFLDAFVVRLTLVPAVMALAKSGFWYHPQWYSKYVPDPDIEGEKLQEQLAHGGVEVTPTRGDGTAPRE